jgi:hypothetical protein
MRTDTPLAARPSVGAGTHDADVLGRALRRLEEFELERDLEILARPAAHAAAARARASEDPAEQILEGNTAAGLVGAEVGAGPEATEAALRCADRLGVEAGLERHFTELVVERALLRIRQHVVRFGDFP